MATNDKDTQAGAPQAASVGAEVNAPALVTIFDTAGRAMQVPPETAEVLISAHGFKRHKVNVAEAAGHFRALFAAAGDAIAAYVDGVLADGMIDPSDQATQATAMQAMRLVEESWAALNLEIARQYPVRQGAVTQLIEQRATVVIDGAPYELSLLDLAARRQLDPTNPAYAEGAVVLSQRMVAVDPGQASYYLSIPGFTLADGTSA